MPELSDRSISDRFQVNAPMEAVAFFHKDTHALKRLTPPPVFVQIQHVEPLANGSVSEFTLWFGPFPIHWRAVHSQVNPNSGFIDTQVRGPMKTWVHHHHWQAINSRTTLMEERIEYAYYSGPRGWLSRLLFARPMLWLMLQYRKWAIRRAVKGK